MCLRIKNSVPKVAENDIICYKMLEECQQERWRGYTYHSPFQEIPIKDEIVHGLFPYVGEGDRSIKDVNGHPSVSEGYIHTYKTLLNAEEMCNYYTKLFENDVHVFECKIPAGTEYYDGLDSNLLPGYASERIVFVKKLF